MSGDNAPPPSRVTSWTIPKRDAGYVGLMGAGAGLGLLKFLLLGRLLTLDDFGVYAYAAVLIQYGVPVASLGILDGLSRRVPIILGEGRVRLAHRVRNACVGALVTTLGTAIVLLLVGLGAAVFFFEADSPTQLVLLATSDAVAFVFFSLGLRDVRSHLHSFSYSAFIAARGVLDVTMVLLVATRWGAPGVLAGETVVFGTLAFVLFRWFVPEPGVMFRGGTEVRATIHDGALIVVAGVLANTGLMSDRLVLGATLERSSFAVYAFHALILVAALTSQNIVYQYFYPRVLHLWGAHKDYAEVFRYVTRLATALLVLSMVGAPLVFPVYRLVGRVFFPEYPIDLVLVGAFYAAGVLLVTNVFPACLLVLGALRAQIVLQLVSAATVLIAVLAAATTNANLVVFGVIVLVGRAILWVGALGSAWILRPAGDPVEGGALGQVEY